MKKSLIIIVISVLVGLLLLISFVLFFSGRKNPSTPAELQNSNLLTNPPQQDKVTIPTAKGDVTVNNVFRDIKDTNGDFFTIYTSETGQWIDFEPHDSAFVLHGASESSEAVFQHDRQQLENTLLAILNVTPEDACKLRAFTLTLGTNDPLWKLKQWSLSFCQ